MNNKSFGQLKTRLFTIKTSKKGPYKYVYVYAYKKNIYDTSV